MKGNENSTYVCPSISVPYSSKDSKHKKNRRALKRNKTKKFHVNCKSVIMVGINSAGITSKLESFNKLLFDIQPTLWFMQETKRNINQSSLALNNLTSNNLQNYPIFELEQQKTKEEGGKGWRGVALELELCPM